MHFGPIYLARRLRQRRRVPNSLTSVFFFLRALCASRLRLLRRWYTPTIPIGYVCVPLTQPPVFQAGIGVPFASRFSLGLIDLDAHRDATHRPIAASRNKDPAVYNIHHNLAMNVNNDTLGLLRAGAPMYPVPYVLFRALTQ